MSRRKHRQAGTAVISVLATIGAVGVVVIAAWAMNTRSHPDRPAGVAPPAQGAKTLSAQDAKTVQASNESQAELVGQEDARVAQLRSAVAPGRYRYSDRKTAYRIEANSALPTMVLTPDKTVYTVADLLRLMPTTFTVKSDGTARLSENLAISPGVTLVIDSSQVGELRLASSKAGFVSIISLGGTVKLTGTSARPLQVISWDAGTAESDSNLADGRAYLRAMGGKLLLSHVDVTDLGFWSGRTGGVAITGSDKITPGEHDNIATGSIADTTITGNAFGLFATVTRALMVERTSITNSVADGLLLHRSVNNTSVTATVSSNNGGAGLVIDRGASGAILSKVTASQNAGDGVKVDGEPLAAAASASGASTTATSGNQILDSKVEHNAQSGIEVLGGTNAVVRGNTVTGNRFGIVVRATATLPSVVHNTVDDQAEFSIYLRDQVANATVTGNRIDHGTTGIFVRDSTGILTGNVIRHAGGHAISLVGATGNSQVTDNTLGGRGTSALDTRRATTDPVVTGNDASAWKPPSVEYAVTRWIWHPIKLIWIGLFLLILISAAVGRHQRERLMHPYANQAHLNVEEPFILTIAAREAAQDTGPVRQYPAVMAGSSQSRTT